MVPRYSLPYRPQARIRCCTAANSHTGEDLHCIDFYMPLGTPVLATRDGIVVHRESRWNSSFPSKRDVYAGNGVKMLHSDDDMTIYWHAMWRSVRVALGQHVRRGQILFLSGQTGFATYPHLHFGVYTSDGWSRIPDFRSPLPPKVPNSRYRLQKIY